jgi:hypothetical protein
MHPQFVKKKQTCHSRVISEGASSFGKADSFVLKQIPMKSLSLFLYF